MSVSPQSDSPANGGWRFGRAMVATYGLALLGAALSVAGLAAAMTYIDAHRLGFTAVMAAVVGFGLSMFAIAYGAAYACERLTRTQVKSPAVRRYRRRLLTMQGLYLVTLLAAALAARALPHGSPWLWLAAIIPPAPVIGQIVVMALYLREETDELQRAILAESALWATGAILSLATLWGFLEMFELVPHIAAWAVFVGWCLCLGPAQMLVRRRYQ